MFKKIVIANRGEIAIRVIRACRELRIPTVAIYSEADRDSLHIKYADEAVCVGPAPSKESYLNIPNIMSAAMMTGADAIHPGYGFFAENANFAEICAACGLKFIGPPPEVLEIAGDKARAKEIMAEAGIPVIPGTKGVIKNTQEALKIARKLDFPLMIKAAAGGGGHGMRIVHNEEALLRELKITQAEAESSFGNSEVYLEKYVEEPRHIEVQIIADESGHILHLGERDCSVQTAKHQKMLEESPCIAVDRHLRNKIGETAIKAARAVGYENLGTVEFLLNGHNKFYFMEMNTRIQVEHTITEMVTGMDLVKEQIRLATGEELGYQQKDISLQGHAIECRITAEDPKHHFMPSSGIIESCIIPSGLGIRVDTHIYPGYVVQPFYDPLLAKVITWGENRNEAIARMEDTLKSFEIKGIKTTIPFHLKMLSNAFFRKGEVYTNFIQRRLSEEIS